MFRLPDDLDGARLNMSETATLISMDPSHLRRLVRRGVFPRPKRTPKGKPFYDFTLLSEIALILKSGIGVSGEEILFHRRKMKKSKATVRQQKTDSSADGGSYLKSILEGCRQLGIEQIESTRIAAILMELFKGEQPPLEEAIPAVARRLMEEN